MCFVCFVFVLDRCPPWQELADEAFGRGWAEGVSEDEDELL